MIATHVCRENFGAYKYRDLELENTEFMTMAFIQALQDIIDFFIQICIIFPYSALTIQRQQPRLQSSTSSRNTLSPNQQVCTSRKEVGMISDTLIQLCTLDESVTSALAADPTLSPHEAWKKLYGNVKTSKIDAESYRIGDHVDEKANLALERAERCGRWGDEKPSKLFLKIFHDALGPVEKDIETAMVSPSLMGSSGVLPLTILSTVPDIVRHQSNLIVQAKHDVFLATNYWQNSVASSFITNAMRELSARCSAEIPPRRVVMKILYDRGSVKQLLDNHHLVSPKEQISAAVGLPPPEEIPNIDLQVMNYHKPMLGTYHCKYMVVDRRVAVLQSNNVQDNDNLEMMIQLEGSVVDGLYDMALISWSKALTPNLPTLSSPARDAPIPCLQAQTSYGDSGKDVRSPEMASLTMTDSGKDIGRGSNKGKTTETTSIENSWIDAGDDNMSERGDGLKQVTSDPKIADQESLATPGTNKNLNPYHPPGTRKVVDVLVGVDQQPANLERPPQVQMKDDTIPSADALVMQTQGPLRVDPVIEAYLNSGKSALSNESIVDPANGVELAEHSPEDPHYDPDILSEVGLVQNQVTDDGQGRLSAIAKHLNHTKNASYKPPHSEIRAGEEWTPWIPHSPTKPFPIALVNRRPYGKPEHGDVYVPQNEAWLAALRYAKESVFIQSPTLNTDVLVPAIIEACERGIDVFCFICLGYNDAVCLPPPFSSSQVLT